MKKPGCNYVLCTYSDLETTGFRKTAKHVPANHLVPNGTVNTLQEKSFGAGKFTFVNREK